MASNGVPEASEIRRRGRRWLDRRGRAGDAPWWFSGPMILIRSRTARNEAAVAIPPRDKALAPAAGPAKAAPEAQPPVPKAAVVEALTPLRRGARAGEAASRAPRIQNARADDEVAGVRGPGGRFRDDKLRQSREKLQWPPASFINGEALDSKAAAHAVARGALRHAPERTRRSPLKRSAVDGSGAAAMSKPGGR